MAGRARLARTLAAGVALVVGLGGVASSANAPVASPIPAPSAASTPVTFAISDDAAQRAFPSELASARAIGIGAARAYVGWADIASRRPARPRDPADPAYDWAQTDADMARYRAAGLAVWIAFWRTPAWASGSTDTAVWPTDPSDLEDFAFAVAKRYPSVAVFLDWNEPNLKLFAKPNTIAAYEPMARAVYAGVEAAHPSAELIAGNLARYRDNGRDPATWAAVLHADAVPMDAFGIHPYPDPTKPVASRSPRTRIDLFDVPALARIAGVPVAVTEFGWSSQFAGLTNQATWTAQAIDVARCTPGLSQFVFWGYHDHPVPDGQQVDPWVQFGWLDATGAPKPVYAAGSAALAGLPDCAAVAQADGAPAGWPDSSTIPPADTAPSCTDVTLSSVAGATVSADLACVDAEGDPLHYVVTTPPIDGTLTQAGSRFTYQPSGGFSGSETFAVSASDGIYSTPITVGVSVTAPLVAPAEPQVAQPVEAPLVAPAAAAAPAVAPLVVTPVALPGVLAGASIARGVASIGLRCAAASTPCTGRLRLSATLKGSRRLLGARAVGIAPATQGRFRVSLSANARKALRAFAGRTISLDVALLTTGSDGLLQTVARTMGVHIPRGDRRAAARA